MSEYDKLKQYQTPAGLLYVALFCGTVIGSSMLLIGLIMAKNLQYLSAPWELLNLMDPILTGRQVLQREMEFIAILTGLLAIVTALCTCGEKRSFGILGENLTEKLRKKLYSTILRKHVGFFDIRDNATSVLTSAMA